MENPAAHDPGEIPAFLRRDKVESEPPPPPADETMGSEFEDTEPPYKVAQDNVTLAQQELSDERDRFAAGVDDNLPVVDAQASVAGAQAQLVQALYQYNVAQLQLARNTGVVETRYRTYLGR